MNKYFLNFQSPVFQLILETAQKNWITIFINLFTHVTSALLEGSTLGIIYLAISYLTQTKSFSLVDFFPSNVDSDTSTTFILSNLNIFSKINIFFPLPPEQIFLVLIFVAVLLQVGLSLSNYANKVSTAYLSAKAQPYVTSKVFERVMAFSYSCISRYKVGDLVLFTNDAALAVDRQITEANHFIVGLSFSLIYLIVIVRLSPLLATAAGTLTLIIAIIQYKLIPHLRKIVRKVTQTQVESAKYITESIQALRLLHTFGTQSQTVLKASQLLKETQNQLQKRAFIFYLPDPILDTLPIIALAILATSAIVFQDNKSTLLPMLLTFLLALQRLSIRLKATAATITQFTDNSARMQRLETILSSQDKVFEHQGNKLFKTLKSDIQFESVSLSYENDQQFALNQLTFTLPRHQITAFVGESGAGKSSVVDLIMGLYQPTIGKITVNQHPLSEYRLDSWRQHIGVVSQDTFVFNNSILENLRYGDPNATWNDIIHAAKIAQAHDFISALPNGYETIVGERGYRLSGGQRQRLALARAFIKKPEILILDEATSALDSESEKLIQQALNYFQKNRTVIVIAHRLSTIAGADQIIVLEKGQIIEQGTHTSLLKKSDRYAHYWKLQSSQAIL